jgi:hypothetical protein
MVSRFWGLLQKGHWLRPEERMVAEVMAAFAEK